MRRPSPKVALLLIGLLSAGCTQTKAFLVSESIQPRTQSARVILMPADIELYELQAGGMLEPKADWTNVAQSHVTAALREELRTKNVELVLYEPPVDSLSKNYQYNQLLKLHESVGGAILVHKYVSIFELPTKKEKFDWSLGHGVQALREEYDAEYCLFVYLRDSYTSTGRALLIIGAALLGVGISGGVQVGFASLVDLRSGEVTWFNRLVSEAGDLRTPEPARDAIKELLDDLPL